MDRLEPGDRATGEIPAATQEPCTLEEWRLMGRPSGLAIEIDAGQSLDDDYEGLAHAREIVLRFPVFMDGRGFSHARRLRAAGFEGTLIAAGDVLPDQWVYLERCGFTQLESADATAEASALPSFAHAYQDGSKRVIAPSVTG
jgi:uncharacterized protein (DUF934 family)